MTTHGFLLFAFAGLMLNLTPGNDMAFVFSRSIAYGRQAGSLAALGVGMGTIVHIFLTTLGLAALIAGAPDALRFLQYAGATYLVYLGIRSLMNRRLMPLTSDNKSKGNHQSILFQGALTNILNPKVILFFLSFLPQFVPPNTAGYGWYIAGLGLWFDLSGTTVNLVVAQLAGSIGQSWGRHPRWFIWQERVTGLILVGLGIRLVV